MSHIDYTDLPTYGAVVGSDSSGNFVSIGVQIVADDRAILSYDDLVSAINSYVDSKYGAFAKQKYKIVQVKTNL